MTGYVPLEIALYINEMWLRTGYSNEVMAIRVNAIHGTTYTTEDITNIINLHEQDWLEDLEEQQ